MAERFWKRRLWKDENWLNLHQNEGNKKKKKVWGRFGSAYNIMDAHRGAVMPWASVASSGAEWLEFIDDVTEDRSSSINSDVHRDVLLLRFC